ncbi:MAG: hypothetical protein ACI87E_002426 [Mariniblastus sp.]|jgi:hypothetical protein
MRRLVLGIAVAVTSLIPVLGMADDQQIADFIKSRLQAEQSQGNLKGFNVDMRVEDGTVWFKGHVSNSAQEMTILRAAQEAGHLGVTQVVDDIEVKSIAAPASPLMNAAYQQQPMSVAPTQAPLRQVSSMEPVPMNASTGVVVSGDPLPFATQGGAAMPRQQMAPQMGQRMAPQMGPQALPASYGQPAAAPSGAPNLPGYAWPGYAANANYGAVAYPKQYSASAWPYIGPFYPYPQVPLGWRKVSLEWDDGWWMLDFHDK